MARGPRKTFDIPLRVRGPDGKSVEMRKTLPLLSDVESVKRPGGIVWNYQTAFLGANSGIEDAHSQALVERDTSSEAPSGDLLFFAVMDGHAGPYTSKLLSKVLIPAVAMEISSLISTPSPYSPPKPGLSLSYAKSLLSFSKTIPAPSKYEFDADPTYVELAIKTAFAKLDSHIVNAPIQLLERIKADQSDTKPYEHPMASAVMLPSMSGSCALLAMLDTARRNMYVACTGDSRAVAGYWEEPSDGSPGYWRAEVLTEDQTGRNPNELKRIQSEHPPDEASSVIQRGRILGGLEPSRAFGTLPRSEPVTPGTDHRSPRPDLKTPPYVTSEPVVTHRKLSFLPDPSSNRSGSPADKDSTSKSTLKFVVLATDGLWDQLSSREVVSLVGGYMSGLKGAVPKPVLAASVRETVGAEGVQGKEEKDTGKARKAGQWAFIDEHVGTHLIRNAFGGADREHLARLVSIPDGLARSFRDDVTVTVIWYDAAPKEEVKAKL
ncbi:hypothetical protein BS47DRAFT_1429948 [Hydnum rufescens UP504]|uniref:PPM-type phosphatase domain-containing protein n=1 Tax=Hydnum rufescens UP504 TaxID=1448309 RepID=A0A9P6AHS8_9AGAM|nr:hypothetical protein BS47DRAFT_1429948 [Hydnum rufescens UP504]